MNDAHEGSQFESRLPDDRAYWDGLAERIVAAAEPILREHRKTRAWWHPMARWSPAIGVAAAAAALILVAVGPPQAARRVEPVSLVQLLSPQEPVAQAVVGGAPAPEISAMLLVESGGER